jgi:hypothetical protein
MPLFERGVAFAARTDLEQTRMLGFKSFDLDSVTNVLLGLLNGLPTVRHVCGVTDEALAILESAGIHVNEDMRIYQTAGEAEKLALALIRDGYKLAWPYPLPDNTYPGSGHLVPRDIWHRLNDKKNLSDIVPAKNLARRCIVSLAKAHQFSFEAPIYLKSGTGAATGSGYAVRYCPDKAAFHAALDGLKSLGQSDAVIIEDDMDVVACWCVSLVIDDASVRYAGVAEQIFDAPGHQIGNVIDPDNRFPTQGVAVAKEVGEAARRLGYRGVAGMDIALTTNGRLIVLDPNFRIQASTAQVMYQRSAAERSGLGASRSAKFLSSLNVRQLARELKGPIEDGWFVPTRVIDGTRHPECPANTTCTGFVLGKTLAGAKKRHAQLEGLLISS